MVTCTINGLTVSVPEGTSILDAAKTVGIQIPTLCYLRDLNEISACRICVVEIEGLHQLVPACTAKVAGGMVIHTDSARALAARRTNLRLILSQHNSNCTFCVRNGSCTLQTLARDMNLIDTPFETAYPSKPWCKENPLIRDESKCVKCMRCIQVCDKVQSLGIWDVTGTGSRTTVGVSLNRKFQDTDCSLCGQCITHCPVGALRERDDTQKVLDALHDPQKITVVQVAPAVRAAWGDAIGLAPDKATVGRMVSALRTLGFNYVFDTNFSADLTIMEESHEFIERFTHRDESALPMFTSCCPGWVRFIRSQYPDMTKNLSTAKSPQQMFGSVAKSYFAEKVGIDPKNLCVVSVMPCVAKKSECAQENQNDACGDPDVDIVLTTRELGRLLRTVSVDAAALPEGSFDSPLGESSGAAVIFGTTGGVMDAALRSAYYFITGKNPDADAFRAVRGMDGWKDAIFFIPGVGDVRVAVVSGLANTRRLLESIRAGKVTYDFVEVMACPGGCAGGGGQPMTDGCELAESRGNQLWALDAHAKIRFSHENPEIQTLYAEYLDKPLSEKAHHLLHTDHEVWHMPLSPALR